MFDKVFQELAESDPRIVEYLEDASCNENLITDVRNPVEDAVASGSGTQRTQCSCSICKVQFESIEKQRNHYKLDWHRYNLHRNINGQSPVTETEFEEKEEVSSISGSESEESIQERKSSTYLLQNQGRVYVTCNKGQAILMYRCLLADKKRDIDLRQSLVNLKNTKWCVLMLGGGHFAGAIFDGSVPILHKTIHCYTVRAGQGGSQSARDNKGGSSAPKSAGASLRRYNEQAMIQHVTEILDAWKDELAKCAIIPFRAPGPFNKSVLFGGKNPILKRSDERLRVIPFPTRRATFKEVKRVHDLLSGITIYESIEAIPTETEAANEKVVNRRNRSKSRSINRAKSREGTERPLPCPLDADPVHLEGPPQESQRKALPDDEADIYESMEALNLANTLEDFGDSALSFTNTRVTKKNKTPSKTRLDHQARIAEDKARQRLENDMRASFKQIMTINNDTAFENFLLQQPEIIAMKINHSGSTPLHLCAEAKKTRFVEILLEHGADVCAKNSANKTPYTMTQDSATREVFKNFAKENPSMFNYAKAQIPLVKTLSDEQIEAKRQKMRELKRAKRERNKDNKRVRLAEQGEQDERERFAMLSDREKRALAAERRILDAKGHVISRCFYCGCDMSGKVPFEYSSNRFCSIDCLKEHRSLSPVVLS